MVESTVDSGLQELQPVRRMWQAIRWNYQPSQNQYNQSQSENYLFQIDQEGTYERQTKYNNINNVCLSVSPLVKLFARSKCHSQSKYESNDPYQAEIHRVVLAREWAIIEFGAKNPPF
ncbi:hypothetical protein SFRURICE_014810 [Spodoptera frugiperda]|nr:hypothetical protein SFRURICE_014810 [Spodoptera frugiperda]